MSGRKRRIAAAVEHVEGRLLLSAISGQVYLDSNRNGSPDPGEPGLAGWTVYLDQNNNGTFDQNTATADAPSLDVPKPIPDLSSVNSTLTLSGVPGAITHLTLKFGITHPYDQDLAITLISPAGTQMLVVNRVGGSGQDFNGTTLDDSATSMIDQGNAPFAGTFRPDTPLARVNGQSADGTWTLQVADKAAGDTGTLTSWSLHITTGEASTVTDASGNYSFGGLAAGTYHVRQVDQSGFTPTAPTGGVDTVTLDGTANATGQDFGNFQPPGSISGTLFNDLNNNGTRDAGEPPLAGWTVYLDANGNGQPDAGELSTVTDSAGHYTLAAPIQAAYQVREVLPAGWTQSSPGMQLNVGQNLNITHEPGNQSEGAIAINPVNPSQMFMVANEDVAEALSMAYSTDGGATWTWRQGAGGLDLPSACCDPSVSWDSYGNLFMSYIDANTQNVVVARSTDGGHSFALLHEFSGEVDQPTTVTGPGVVWVTWNQGGAMVATGAAVTGLGATGNFSALETVPGPQGSFGDVAVGPAGQLMETYQDDASSGSPANIYVSVDPDGLGPQGFSTPVVATTTNVGWFDFIPPQSGRSVDAEAGLAWDRTNGPHHGRVYLVYTNEVPAAGSGNTDIFLRHSDDNGLTWSAPLRVNDDATANAQFLPRIAIDQTTGNIALSWYDSRNDNGQRGPDDTDGQANTDAEVYATASVDGGQSVLSNVRVSAGATNAADANSSIDLGDYTGLAFQSGRFFPLWADNSNSTLDNPDGQGAELDQYTAAITLSVAPGGAGRTVVAGPGDNVSGVDFGNHQTAPAAAVVGRSLFYNDSVFDGNNPAANVQDDAAVATDKQALQAGQTSSAANISSYSRGINGIMVDLSNAAGTLTAADFDFKTGNDNNPSGWAEAPAPLSVSSRAGPGGSTRVEIIWADNAIQNTWLQVTVKADAVTALASADVFYFGSLVGESMDSAAPASVTQADETAARSDPHSFLNPATVTNLHDYNRDGKVDVADQIIARNNAGATLAQLAPAAAAVSPARRRAAKLAAPTVAASKVPGVPAALGFADLLKLAQARAKVLLARTAIPSHPSFKHRVHK